MEISAESPSFTSYSSQNFADIAARVIDELNLSHTSPFEDDDVFYSPSLPQNDAVELLEEEEANNEQNDGVEEEPNNDDVSDDESEFEFAVLCRDEENSSSPISADEIFYNGQIRPIYPLFNTSLVYSSNDAVSYNLDLNQKMESENQNENEKIRLPLRNLLSKERENGNASSSCSSSEAGDDLEGVPPGTYCVWVPKKKNEEEDESMMKKKSKSTGSTSKRWRFRDLLYRSNSDGKDTFVFLTPSNNHHHQQQQQRRHVGGGDATKRREKVPAAAKKRGGERKSYLPYRQDLVGLFSNVNGVSRSVRPF